MGELRPPEPLSPDHDLSGFSCGRPELDAWLRQRAGKAEGASARTYVLCEGKVVFGYYCLAAGAIARESVPGRLRRNMPDPLPVMIVGRLAVDRSRQRRGLGKALLKDALLRIAQAAAIVGLRAVVVHAIDSEAEAFYRQFGFIEYPTTSRVMFLPIETLAAVLAQPSSASASSASMSSSEKPK